MSYTQTHKNTYSLTYIQKYTYNLVSKMVSGASNNLQ